MVLNGKRMVNGVSSIGRCFNDTIDMTAVFSAVEIGRELAELGISDVSFKFLRQSTLQC